MKTQFELFLDNVRLLRNRLLTKSDWTQVADVDLTDGEKQAWKDYRQILRDIPENLTEEDRYTFNFPLDPNGKGWER